MKRYSTVEYFTEREIKLRTYIRNQHINENTHTCSISSVLTPKSSKGSPRPAVFLAAPIVVRVKEKRGPEEREHVWKNNHNLHVDLPVTPSGTHVEETGSIRCGLFEGLVVSQSRDVSLLTGARSCITWVTCTCIYQPCLSWLNGVILI